MKYQVKKPHSAFERTKRHLADTKQKVSAASVIQGEDVAVWSGGQPRPFQIPSPESALQQEKQPLRFDICLLCAEYEEANAFIEEVSACCNVFFVRAFRQASQLEYRYATIQNWRGETLILFVTWLAQAGLPGSVPDVPLLLQEIQPRFVAMTGVCAGNQERVRCGDLIIARSAYYPESQALLVEQGFEEKMAGVTEQILQYVQSFHAWIRPIQELQRQKTLCKELHAHIGVMASSQAVGTDQPLPAQVHYDYGTIGSDRETATFYRTLRNFPWLHGLVVKGVSHYGESDTLRNASMCSYAAHASALYMLSFIQEYVTEERMPWWSSLDYAVPSPPARMQTRQLVPEQRERAVIVGRSAFAEQVGKPEKAYYTVLTQSWARQEPEPAKQKQIALEQIYTFSQQDQYMQILWINAASRETVIASMRTVGERLPIFRCEREKQDPIEPFKCWLKDCKLFWLLIFENVKDPLLLLEYFPPQGNGQILLIT